MKRNTSDRMTIWPAYIDQSKSRSKGRMIPRRISVKSPKLSEIADACRKLGLDPQVEPDKSYPRSWWETSGRVIVNKTSSKSDIARQISRIIKESR
ncbi:MAG: signal recognition particle protein Srp19 [Halobacteriota archaeon]|nr:signal recognition particle protein Srp19 [Halobacteriota archaeon]